MAYGEGIDTRVRLRAFDFLSQGVRRHGDVLPRELLAAGFELDGIRVPLIGPQGIFKPAILPDMPLSITTVPPIEGRERPYDDEMGPDGLLRYRYRGTDPGHRDNAGLRRAMARQTPLVYLYGIVPGQYMPVWPVYIVNDDPGALTFSVAVDEQPAVEVRGAAQPGIVAEARRAYVTAVVQRRLHQQSFRERVLRAYQDQCAVCHLKRRELLSAAHILPDGHPRGEPIISNGLALCALHHVAFDRNILGVRPDLTVELSRSLLRQIDGPMLEHGLRGFHGMRIAVPHAPRLRPNADFLAERYELFRKVG
ncbi:MAG: HNH endonuclease [Candidatus Rokuibacteriota bacterium]